MSVLRISRFCSCLLFGLLSLFAAGCQERSVEPAVGRTFVSAVAAVAGDGRATIGWGVLENGSAAELQIHRSRSPGFLASGLTFVAAVSPDRHTYTDTGLTNGVWYYYRVVPAAAAPYGRMNLGISEEAVPVRPFAYGGVTAISFDEHIRPILRSGCAVHGCHAGQAETPAKGLHGGELSLASWEEIFHGGSHGAVVIPYKASKSHLVYHLNSDTLLGPVSLPHMPYVPGLEIPRDQIDLLIRWINDGAANDVGAVAFSVYPQGRVLVTNQAEDLVSVVDVATNLVARYVQAGVPNVFQQPPQAPHNVTVDGARGVYYVNLVAAGKVLKFRLSDNAKLGEVTGIISPTQVALSLTGDTAFVAQFAAGTSTIRLFNTQTMELFPTVVGSQYIDKPHGVQVTPDGRQLWVTGNLSDNVLVVDLADLSTSLIQLNNQLPGSGGELLPYQTTMTPDGRKVYVSCQKSNEVIVVSRDSLAVMKRIVVGQWPLILKISPDGSLVYVADRNSGDVTVLSTAGDDVVATIPAVGPQPHGIDITPDGRFAYVSCENVVSQDPPHHPTSGSKIPGFVAVIDLGTNTVIERIEVGAFAAGVAAVPY